MINQSMQRKLESGEALDVRKIGREVEPGRYRLDKFVADVDYCDAQKEVWIWSIGKNEKTGEVFASTDQTYYQNPECVCLWLR